VLPLPGHPAAGRGLGGGQVGEAPGVGGRGLPGDRQGPEHQGGGPGALPGSARLLGGLHGLGELPEEGVLPGGPMLLQGEEGQGGGA
ncbi:hypothetical protein DF186_18590, partial [Enterococcus hirae]